MQIVKNGPDTRYPLVSPLCGIGKKSQLGSFFCDDIKLLVVAAACLDAPTCHELGHLVRKMKFISTEKEVCIDKQAVSPSPLAKPLGLLC